MASEARRKTSSLKKDLEENPGSFSFIQAVRILKFTAYGSPLLSEFVKEYLRVTPYLSLGFPGSDVVKIDIPEDNDEKFKIIASFLGLYGPSSPLPTYYTEELIDERSEGGSVKKDFIDIINSPFFELYYQTVAKYNLLLKLEDEQVKNYKKRLYSLIGLGSKGFTDGVVQKDKLLKYTGLLTTSPRSAMGLKTLLSDYFDIKDISINEFVERKVNIPQEQKAILGKKNNSLGNNCHIGSCITDYSGKYAVTASNLSEKSFHEFIPSGKKFSEIKDVIKFYSDQPLEAELRLEPEQNEIKKPCLGGTRWSELGYNTWLFSDNYVPENNRVKFSAE